jgi:hypothetical protein
LPLRGDPLLVTFLVSSSPVRSVVEGDLAGVPLSRAPKRRTDKALAESASRSHKSDNQSA